MLASCKTDIVVKNVFVPTMHNKGDGRIAGDLNVRGFAVNGGCAFFEHIAAMASGFAAFSTSGGFLSKDNKQLELGFGYFTRLNPKYKGVKLLSDYETRHFFEVFAGGSKAFVYSTVESDPISPFYSYGTRSGDFRTLFLQMSYSRLRKKVNAAYTLKFQYMDFGNYLSEGVDALGPYQYTGTYPSIWIVQPMATYKMGVDRPVCFTTQFGFNLSESQAYYLSAQNFTCRFGFEWRFNRLAAKNN
jgi:hypothetical protein